MAGRGSSVLPSDEALIQRVAAGDQAALKELYARWAPFFHHTALKSLDAEAARDQVQEVFFQIWTKAATFNPAKGSFRNWVLQILHFRILNELRRRTRKPALPENGLIEEESDERYHGPAEETWDAFRKEALKDAVERLPQAQRQALSLAFFEELSHEEIAQTLGLPLGTVKGRIRLALRQLRTSLVPLAMGLLLVWGLTATVLSFVTAGNLRQTAQKLAQLTAPEVEVKKLESGTVKGSCSYNTAEATFSLALKGLPPAPEGRVYKLWADWDGEWAALGSLELGPDGTGRLQAADPRWTREPQSIKVTLEAEASPAPGGPEVVSAHL